MSVCYGNGRYVAIGQNGHYRCAISTDGIKWRHFTNPVPKDVSDRWRAICYGGSTDTYTRKHDHHRYVAVGDNVCAASTDGMTWIVGNIDNIEWRDICYGNGMFITVGHDCDGCRVSRDGLTWNESYGMGEAGEWRTICYGDGMCVATNDCGLRYMVMSFNDTREWDHVGYHLCPSEARDMAVGCSCYANGMAVLMSVDGGMVTHVIVQRRKRKPLALSEAVSVNVPLRKVKRVVWKVVKSTVRSKRKGATVSECDDTSMTTEGVSL